MKRNWKKVKARKHSINEIVSGQQQVAPGKDQIKDSRINLSLARTQDLLNLAGEILGILHQKTHRGTEARFVANIVKWTVSYWQPEERNDKSGK